MKSFIAKLVFSVHLAIGFIWFGLFFIPENWLPNKIALHFYLTLILAGHQFLWGFLIIPWTKRFRLVCVLTTIVQLLRGKSISDPKNYEHSFTQEIFKNASITISHRIATLITFGVLAITATRYFLS